MADMNTILTVVVADVESKLSDFAIKDKQLIFLKEKRKIALDFNGKRTFYNQIEILQTDNERQTLKDPEVGLFYFVIGTATLWFYNSEWICITSPPQEIVFMGETLPELGSENTLYVNTEEKTISVWDVEKQSYDIVANKTEYEFASEEEISSLF